MQGAVNTALPQVVRVMLTGGFSRRYTNGVREFEVQARTVRGVIRAMDELFPGLGEPKRYAQVARCFLFPESREASLLAPCVATDFTSIVALHSDRFR